MLRGHVDPSGRSAYEVTTTPQAAARPTKEPGQQILSMVAHERCSSGKPTPRSVAEDSAATTSAARTRYARSGDPSVAVAADEADIGLGTDTGGSIRIPVACCGIVGLKTT